MNFSNTYNAGTMALLLSVAALMSACGGAKENSATISTKSAASSSNDKVLEAKQAEQDAAFGGGKSGTAFKADAVANQIRFVADFDGDGKDDILWQTTTGATHISFMNSTAVDHCAALGVQTDRIMGTGDFNGDGKADIVWRNMGTGAVRISLMNGGTVSAWLNVGQSPISLSVKLEAVGDFDGNGRADMLWRNQSTGNSVMSFHATDGSVTSWPQVSRFINPANTTAMKVGDFDGDGKTDIVWRNLSTGNVVVSIMNGNVPAWQSLTPTPISPTVALEAMGDFDGDGKDELLWRNTTTGNSVMSYHNANGSVASWPVLSNYINPTTTSAQGVGDFDGDGKDDILWRNLGTGNTVISLMDRTVRSWVGFSFSICPLAERLPHSGVTAAQCLQASSDTLVACSSAGSLALNSQQDGHRVAVNPMSYSEVPNPAGGFFSRTECVRDNVTGLVWEGKTANGPRAGDNLYTNYDDPTLLQRFDGSAFVNPTQAEIDVHTNSVGYVNYVNSVALCGYTDWRLPTADELQGIVNYGLTYPNPSIDSTWFPNARGWGYWSLSPYAGSAGYAWFVFFYGGFVGYDYRTFTYAVRLVRASQ